MTLWIHLTCIHILLAYERSFDRPIPSDHRRPAARLSLRGSSYRATRPCGPYVDRFQNTRNSTTELERTANRDGIVIVRGQELALGTSVAGPGSRYGSRLALIHATAGNMLLKTLPNHFHGTRFD